MPYLTAADYADTFGATETKRITSENGVAIDTGKVERAIQWASDLADGYIGRRYALPLAVVPPSLVPIVADLARERLFPQNPPKVVTDNAQHARDWLVDVSKGVVALPVAGGESAPEEPRKSTVRRSGDARPSVFNDCSLGGFVGFAPPGC